MSKVAFIGPQEIVIPLKTSGIDAFACDSAAKAETALDKISGSKEYSVIFITEYMANECMDKISELEDKLNIVLLPDHRGSMGLYKQKLNSLIKQATGAVNL